MYDLFRFIMLRPAEQTNADDALTLSPNTPFSERLTLAVANQRPRHEIKKLITDFIAGSEFVKDKAKLTYAAQLDRFHKKLSSRATSDLYDLHSWVDEIFDQKTEQLLQDGEFLKDKGMIQDSLIAAKLNSSSLPILNDLCGYIRIIDLIERVGENDPALAEENAIQKSLMRLIVLPSSLLPITTPDTIAQAPSNGHDEMEKQKKLISKSENLQQLYQFLSNISPEDVDVFKDTPTESSVNAFISDGDTLSKEMRSLGQNLATDALTLSNAALSPLYMARSVTGSKLTLKAAAADRIPTAFKTLLADINADITRVPLPTLLDRISTELTVVEKSITRPALYESSPVRILGNQIMQSNFFGIELPHGLLDRFMPILPTTRGTVKPVGIGDLLVVKQQLTGYESGEVAHIENILKGEINTREVTRSETTEETTTTENERISEEERDLQSTERFEMQRESQSIVSLDGRLKGGGMQSPSYGPVVEFENTNEAPLHGAQQLSEKQSSKFSQDVTSRASSKITERVRTQLIRRTVKAFTEKTAHSYDNKDGDENITGVYQWVDKVYQNQVFNYGKRLFYDIVVPEPAAFFIQSQGFSLAEGVDIVKPALFDLTAADITEWNYTSHAAKYGATGIEPPPALNLTVSKSFAEQSPDKNFINKNLEIAIPKDYEAKWYRADWVTLAYKDQPFSPQFTIHLGTANVTAGASGLHGETNSISVLISGWNLAGLGLSVHIYCQRTETRLQLWQIRTYETILAAYRQRIAEYEERIASLQASLRVGAYGKSGDEKKRIEKTELKKSSISVFTHQHYDIFNGVEQSTQTDPVTKKGRVYDQIKLPHAETQGKYIRFFEQAFEWEQMMHQYYPYFWGRKDHWINKMNYNDNDPQFAEFLKAGAARVLVPVRPGFESALLHFMETGEIWNGGDLPAVNSPLYVPLLQEIKENSHTAGAAIPYSTDTWKTKLPTTLVMLRDDAKLPAWKKEDNEWVPID